MRLDTPTILACLVLSVCPSEASAYGMSPDDVVLETSEISRSAEAISRALGDLNRRLGYPSSSDSRLQAAQLALQGIDLLEKEGRYEEVGLGSNSIYSTDPPCWVSAYVRLSERSSTRLVFIVAADKNGIESAKMLLRRDNSHGVTVPPPNPRERYSESRSSSSSSYVYVKGTDDMGNVLCVLPGIPVSIYEVSGRDRGRRVFRAVTDEEGKISCSAGDFNSGDYYITINELSDHRAREICGAYERPDPIPLFHPFTQVESIMCPGGCR